MDNGKTASIVSYFFIVGWLIAYFGFYLNNKTSLASYQLRQTLLFHLVSMAVRWILGLILGAVWLTTGFVSTGNLLWLVNVVFFVLWIIGLLGAINDERRPIPFMGQAAQNIFSGI